jgi:hypothetical protein
MTGTRIFAFAVLAALASISTVAPATSATYDGSWNMVLVTTNGHCGQIRVGLDINGGRIKSTSGKFVMRPIHIVGHISGSGATRMNGVAGPRKAEGTGHFNRVKGYGKWNGTGPSGVCSGIWTAVRA